VFDLFSRVRFRKNSGLRNIKGDNNLIQNNGSDLSQVTFNIEGEHNTIIIHQNVKFNQVSFNIYGSHNRVIIGKDCQFNGPSEIWNQDDNCLVSIGAQSTFEGVLLSATESGSRLIIGKDCMFSYDVDVRTGDSHAIISTEDGHRINFAKDIVFGEHVWVASHCVFLKGTVIPDGCVVGNSTLVNKAFSKQNTILAGHPAEVIKEKILWHRERNLQGKPRVKPAPRPLTSNVKEITAKSA